MALQALSGQMPDLLDDYLGRGALKLKQDSETQDYDSAYYEAYDDHEASTAASYELARQVQEEGTVLLKNNGLLPLEKGSTLVPFGYRFLKPVYGQLTSNGSAKWVMDPVTPQQGLQDYFTVEQSTIECMEKAGDPTPVVEAEGTQSAGTLNSLLGGDSKIYEHDPSIYDSIGEQSGSTAVAVLTGILWSMKKASTTDTASTKLRTQWKNTAEYSVPEWRTDGSA